MKNDLLKKWELFLFSDLNIGAKIGILKILNIWIILYFLNKA